VRGRAGVLTSADGRIRLGWRLTGFVLVAAGGAALIGALTPGGPVWGSLALLTGSIVAGWLWLAGDGRGPGALGFHLSPETVPEAAKGLAVGIGVGIAVIGVMAALGGVRWIPQDGTAGAWLWGGLGTLAFLTLPAAAEEALLRGYPLQALAEVWGPGRALVATSVVFGALHLGNPGATALGTVNVAAAGMLLGVVYLRTGSLWWATGVHLGWNWAHGYLADVPVSGLEVVDAPFYEGVATGPEWLGGGAFGPEGSVVATVLVLAATAACWWGPWLQPGAAALAAKPLALVARGSTRENGVNSSE